MSRDHPTLSVVQDSPPTRPEQTSVEFGTFYAVKQELTRTRKQLREARDRQVQAEGLNLALLKIARALVRRAVIGNANPDGYIADVLALGTLGQTVADQFRDFAAKHAADSASTVER